MKNVSAMTKILMLSVLTFMPLSTWATQGGAGPGGGNAQYSRPASSQEIDEAIKNVKPALVLVAQKLQMLADFGQTTPTQKTNGADMFFQNLWASKVRLLKRLYPRTGQQTIYDAIRKAHFLANDTGPCFEADGKTEVDGSVATADGSICLSVLRLTQDTTLPTGEVRKKLTTADMNVEVAALAFHEVSHKMGFNETEAKLVQGDAEANLTNEAVVKGLEAVKYFDFLLGAASAKTGDVLAGIEASKSQASICVVMGEVQMRTQSLSENLAENPLVKDIQILTAQEQALLSGVIAAKSSFATLYCGSDALGIKGASEILFKGQPSISLGDLMTATSKKTIPATFQQLFANYRIYNTASGGLPAVQQEMTDIETLLGQIQREVQIRWNLK